MDEPKVTEALELVSMRKFVEAERSLIEAEESVRTTGDALKIDEVLVSLSRVHLCQGLPSKALADLERVPGPLDEQPSEVQGRLLFQRGIALLVAGREEEAHASMTRFIELSERAGDRRAEARGHYYLALVYERHGEPCMASAELEIGREAADPEDHYLLARMNAFLAHLWLRRLAIEEAGPEVEEALRMISSIAVDSRTSSIGIVNLVDAEFHAAKSDCQTSKEKFDAAVQALRRAGMGAYLEAVAHSWYGEMLLVLGMTKEGVTMLGRAETMFRELGNISQAERAAKMIAGGPGGSKKSPG